VDDGSPSATAQRVAARRLGFERQEAPFGDPSADERLARDVAGSLLTGSSAPPPDDPMARYLKARTAFFDRVLLNALDREVGQVVIAGAGYDARALRYAKAGVKWFEVDHPATQADKRARLERLGIGAGHITFVAADFREPGLGQAIIAGGYEPAAPSLILLEGVAVYLDLPVLESVLTELRGLSTVGCRLAVSFSVSGGSADRDARREQFQAGVGALGEPASTFLGPEESAALLARSGWAVREISDKARLAGFVVAEPGWPPSSGAKLVPRGRARTEELMELVQPRAGIEALPAHLERTYAIKVERVSQLDLGVFRVDRAGGPSWVARVFPRARSLEVVKGDAEILAHLEQRGFPAERLAHPDPVSVHEDQAVLVTVFAPGEAPPGDETTFKMFGDLLGRLHTLHTMPTAPTTPQPTAPQPTAPQPPAGVAPPTATAALARPGGAWHHLVPQGGYSEEIAAARALLEEARPRVPPSRMVQYEALREELVRADDGAGLPVGLVHPDFVPVNGVASPEGDVVVVDWAGAGSGPRLPSLAFLLWAAAGAGSGCVKAVFSGYRRHVQLEPAELDRLEAALPVRWTLIQAWSVLVGRRRLAGVADELPAGRARAAHVAARVRELCG
jgi:methyltransferase (TIGR00027 family)